MVSNQELTDAFHAAIREPNLMICLGRNLFGGQPLVHLRRPGDSVRSKAVDLLPSVLVGASSKHSDMLEHLANAMRQAGL